MLKKINLKNKTALVTGAGKGLGKACAIALAEAGAKVIILSRTKSDLDKVSKVIKKTKGKSKSFVCDVTNTEEFKKVLKKIPRLDILVNNAGTILRAPAEEHSDEYWDKVVEVNLNSQFILSRELGAEMIKKGSGKNLKQMIILIKYSLFFFRWRFLFILLM